SQRSTVGPGFKRLEPPVALSHVLALLCLLSVEALVLSQLLSEQLQELLLQTKRTTLDFLALAALSSVAAGLAALWLSRDRLLETLNEPRPAVRLRSRRWLALHTACFALLLVVTVAISRAPYGAGLSTVWVLAAVVTLGSLGLVLLPRRTWWTLARIISVPTLLGAVIGSAGFLLATTSGQLWEPLIRSTFLVVRGLLNAAGFDVHVNPRDFRIGTPTFEVGIASACSGYEGIGLVWAFLAAYLWIFRRQLRFPHVLLLIPLGTAVIWFTNAVRIALLIVVGTLWSPAVALTGFHSAMGAVMFMAVGLSLIGLGSGLEIFRHDSVSTHANIQAAAPFLVPFMVLVGLRLGCAALSTDFDYLYPLRIVAVSACLAWYWSRLPVRWQGWSWPAAAAGALVYILWIALEPTSSNTWALGQHMPLALQQLPMGWAAVWVASRVAGSVVTVPLVEELAFRGFLPRRIQRSDFTAIPVGAFTFASFIASSVLFGLLHERWIAGTLAGMAYALVLMRRRRLLDAIIAHATTNALIAVHVLVGGRWSLWN
ncbi:MAG TPA: exosortase E/protease, VPEID-CTERM system, partial [Candidatus Acidoferrales bacterium]|nr:exosortase E/protease, VPEID-CTERM system [Candidatus Acidoferrales bacterium]